MVQIVLRPIFHDFHVGMEFWLLSQSSERFHEFFGIVVLVVGHNRRNRVAMMQRPCFGWRRILFPVPFLGVWDDGPEIDLCVASSSFGRRYFVLSFARLDFRGTYRYRFSWKRRNVLHVGPSHGGVDVGFDAVVQFSQFSFS